MVDDRLVVYGILHALLTGGVGMNMLKCYGSHRKVLEQRRHLEVGL